MGKQKLIFKEESKHIMDSAYEVYNTLGSGFLEKVYENSLVVCLKEQSLDVKQQYPINVYFKDNIVGEYYEDIIVNDNIIIELKAVKKLKSIHEAQIINYLKATKFKLGTLINFSKDKFIHKRFIDF